MNYIQEAKDTYQEYLTIDESLKDIWLLNSIAEFSDGSGISVCDIRQFIYDLTLVMNDPAFYLEEDIEDEDPIIEVYSRGILDS